MRKLKLNSFWFDSFSSYRSSLCHHAPSLQPHNSHSGLVLVSMQLKAVQINPDYTTHPTHRNSIHLTIFTFRSVLPSLDVLVQSNFSHRQNLQSISIFPSSPFLPLRRGLIKSPRQPPLFNRCQLLIRDFQIFLQTSPFGHHSPPPINTLI